MSLIKTFRLSALLVSLLATITSQPAFAADSFYLRLLERGVQELELGLVDSARQKFRIASFGFLDEPVLLAESLVQLGRAQAQGGDSTDLTKTVMRLVEIEDRFGAYSEVDSGLKTAFENSLRISLPQALLARLSLFEHLTVKPEVPETQPKPLTLKEQTKALERELAVNPEDAGNLLALSRIYHTGGKLKPASRLLDRLLAAQPENQEALCLRADIAIDKKECSPTLAGLGPCAPLTTTDTEDAFVLECLASARRFVAAEAFLLQLSDERRQAPKVVRAAGKFAKATEQLEAETTDIAEGEPEPQIEAPTEAGSSEQPVESQGNSESELNPALEERLLDLREAVRQSEFREQLEEALKQAMTLADDYPDSTEAQYLVAEVAYLSAEWQLVSAYFNRGGHPGVDRPELLFYLAVAEYELGNTREAAVILRSALPALARNPFVDGYVARILASPPS